MLQETPVWSCSLLNKDNLINIGSRYDVKIPFAQILSSTGNSKLKWRLKNEMLPQISRLTPAISDYCLPAISAFPIFELSYERNTHFWLDGFGLQVMFVKRPLFFRYVKWSNRSYLYLMQIFWLLLTLNFLKALYESCFVSRISYFKA